ncbi:MAG: sigma-70 family RNA polymerase sigma factor [Desulfobacteraceae bacterium]|nr:sigma-70 family RNA polymerase sigma factor [Desulfobacteraceae bacterium]
MGASERLNPEAWVDAYGDALFRFAVCRVDDSGIAEDLVQDTFLAAVKSRDHFQGQSSEKTWLFAILKHKVIDFYRKRKSSGSGAEMIHDADEMVSVFDAGGGWYQKPTHWRTDPEKSFETKEFIDHFYDCLADLPKRNADAFVFREIDGMSTDEICRKLDISENNCWVILYRARVLLRRCLE